MLARDPDASGVFHFTGYPQTILVKDQIFSYSVYANFDQFDARIETSADKANAS